MCPPIGVRSSRPNGGDAVNAVLATVTPASELRIRIGHNCLADCFAGDEAKAYWKRPNVWEDGKASYETFFKRNPDTVGYRKYYARYAYRCEQWDELSKQLSFIRPADYEFFRAEKNLRRSSSWRKSEQQRNLSGETIHRPNESVSTEHSSLVSLAEIQSSPLAGPISPLDVKPLLMCEYAIDH